jgi:tetratricopeptide (TPR) repeat protein
MDLQSSEEAFEEAFQHLQRGTEDPMERAILLDLHSSLCRMRQRFEESLQLSRRATSVFRKLGERHRVGRAIINSSIAFRFMGDPEQAVSLLHQSLTLIDHTREPRLVLCAIHNLIDNLTMGGRFMEAQRTLLRARYLYQQFPDPRVQSRRLWVEAEVAYGLGRREAEVLLREAHDAFRSVNTSYDVDLSLRDLAALRARHRGQRLV